MSISRRSALAGIVGLALAASIPALAASDKFTPAALAQAQKAGGPILVEVTAPWCPTCKAQKPILGQLLSTDKFKSFAKLEVDFDSQKSDLRALKVQQQSTLIVFKGDKEVARSVGDTKPASIEALLAKAL